MLSTWFAPCCWDVKQQGRLACAAPAVCTLRQVAPVAYPSTGLVPWVAICSISRAQHIRVPADMALGAGVGAWQGLAPGAGYARSGSAA